MYHPIVTIAAFTFLEALRNRLIWLVLVVCVIAFALTEFVGEIAITEGIQIKAGVLASTLRLFAVFVTASTAVYTGILHKM
jgi:hypothetical protein